MTKDEELKEAREWVKQKDLEGDLSFTYRGLAELCIAYRRHRLETDVDGFNLSQITAKQSLDEPPKEK